jgi:hypothetical protein
VFDLLNGQLIAELPQLLDLRVPYFDPSFEAMIRMQCKFAEEGYEKMSGVQRCASLSNPRRCPPDMGVGTSTTACETITRPASSMRRSRVSCRRCASCRSAAPAEGLECPMYVRWSTCWI